MSKHSIVEHQGTWQVFAGCQTMLLLPLFALTFPRYLQYYTVYKQYPLKERAMTKKYIYVKNSIRQFEADNWLLMIPSDKLSSDSKLVYLILKRIQCTDMS